jgi:acylpyruvate hydrolase
MPPVTDPVHVFGLAGNYIRRTPGGEPGDYDLVEYPSAFLKPLSALVGHDHEINLKGLLTTITSEPEFSIVIGRRATNVAQADAMDYVAGYTILNDVSSRDLQAGRHTSQGATMRKGLDSFAPVGPYITLKEDVPNPHNLAIAGSINGKPSQVFNPNTSFMTFTVEELIAFYSERVTLLPGDIIATGVPVAVMDSEAGDLVELTIGNLGTLRNRVVAKPVPGHRNFPPRAVGAVPTR